MAVETFVYRYFIAAPADKIYSHLADPLNYIGLSPLIVSVRDVETSRDSQGHKIIHYASVERFNFLGFIHYDNPLKVTMTLAQPPTQLISDVVSPARVRVRFVFDLQPDTDGTWIEETVTAQMPRLLQGFVVAEAKRVQVERARILKERLEAAG